MDERTRKQVVIWLMAGCLLVLLMVIIGGITRLTGSGLSMVEWNLVAGSLPPANETEWHELFGKYKNYPEFRLINYDFALQDFKRIFWWEYIHRFLGRFIGVVFLVPFLWFVIRRRISRDFSLKLLVLLFLGGLQGFLGWYMVKSGLAEEPQVSHYWLAIHLSAAFLTFSYTFWLVLDVLAGRIPAAGAASLKQPALACLCVLFIQVAYGAFTAGLKAGAVYNTFPLMGYSFLPDAVTAMRPLWQNFFENRAGVQFIHRILAFGIAALALWLWIRSRRLPVDDITRHGVTAAAALTAIQFLLGVLTLLHAAPLALALLHQAGAFFLLTSVLFVLYRTGAFPSLRHPSTGTTG